MKKKNSNAKNARKKKPRNTRKTRKVSLEATTAIERPSLIPDSECLIRAERVTPSDPSGSIEAVKEHLKATISTLLLKRTAAEYGCTPTHLWRVLRKSKQSSKLLLWLTDNHPELLTAKTQKREDAKTVR